MAKKKKELEKGSLKSAVQAMNVFLVGEKQKKIVFVGKKTDYINESLKDAVDGFVSLDRVEDLPDEVVEYYNEHLAEDDVEEAPEKKPAKKKKSTKKADKKSTKKADKKEDKKSTKKSTKKADKKEDKKEDKPAKKKKRTASADVKKRYDMIEKLVKTGKYTKPQVVEKVAKKFTDVKEITIATYVQDSMNPTYNKLSKLTIKGEDGKLSFGK